MGSGLQLFSTALLYVLLGSGWTLMVDGHIATSRWVLGVAIAFGAGCLLGKAVRGTA